jgi:HAD superfamily hydrolase (TIGR01509 family)
MKNTPDFNLPLSKLPRAILFDYDGVLVSSEPIHLSAWMQLLIELGLPPDREFVKRSIGRTAPEIMAALLDQYRPEWDPKDYDVHQLAQRKNVFYLSMAESELQVFPGVREGLLWLKSQGIKSAVVSNGRRNELEKTMKTLEIFQLFDEIISRDDVNRFKPDPTPYLVGAATFGLDPSECVAIEDSPPGLEAALMAKVPAAAVLTSFPKEFLEAPVPGRPDLKPRWIGSSIQEFFDWLKRSSKAVTS